LGGEKGGQAGGGPPVTMGGKGTTKGACLGFLREETAWGGQGGAEGAKNKGCVKRCCPCVISLKGQLLLSGCRQETLLETQEGGTCWTWGLTLHKKRVSSNKGGCDGKRRRTCTADYALLSGCGRSPPLNKTEGFACTKRTLAAAPKVDL